MFFTQSQREEMVCHLYISNVFGPLISNLLFPILRGSSGKRSLILTAVKLAQQFPNSSASEQANEKWFPFYFPFYFFSNPYYKYF